MPSLTGFLITFCIGVAATLGWQSYGDPAREMIASSYPQLGWVAPQLSSVPPDQQQLNAMSLDAVRQSIDRIAIGFAASQEQITRSIDRIAASQEEMARSVNRLTTARSR